MVAACSTAPGGGAQAGNPGLGTREVTLRVWHWDNYQIEPQTKNAADLTARYSSIKAVLELVPQAQYLDKLFAQVSGGSPPDTIGVSVTGGMNALQANGMLSPLDAQMKRDRLDTSDFYEHVLRTHTWAGNQVGLPYNWTVVSWFFNEDLFKKHGQKTPYEHWKAGTWTWDTYLDITNALRRPQDDLYGTAALPAQNATIGFPLAWSNDGDVFDKDYSKATFEQGPALQTWEWMHRVTQLSPKGDAAREATPLSGKVGLWYQWLPNYLLYRTQVGNQLPFTYGVVPPPAMPRTKKSVFIVNAPGWGVVKESKNQEEAWALLRQLVAPESMRRTYLEAASPPARKSLSTSRDFWKSHPDLPSPDVMLELVEARSKFTRGLPRLSNFADLQAVLNEEFGAAWADKQSVRDAALKTSQRATQLLKDGAVDK